MNPIDALEREHRPSWAEEGEWDDASLIWQRDMPSGRVYLYKTVTISLKEVTVYPSEICTRGADDGMTAEDARAVVAEINAAIALLGADAQGAVA
jgi:hypothetical protein